MIRNSNELKVGDRVAVYFKDAESIGYNGTLWQITMQYNNRFLCKSVNGTGFVWAEADELIRQRTLQEISKKHNR